MLARGAFDGRGMHGLGDDGVREMGWVDSASGGLSYVSPCVRRGVACARKERTLCESTRGAMQSTTLGCSSLTHTGRPSGVGLTCDELLGGAVAPL